MKRPISTYWQRRHVPAILARVVATLILSGATPLAAEPVAVEQGLLEGATEDGLTVYKGIPFAAPPVGDLRWRAPQPAPTWQGVREADTFGSACLQANGIPEVPTSSEDCLYLNVWTPATQPDERLPVLVWIHGGGFSAGATMERLYHGDELAKKGVVVITIGYRLGALGFLAHPELSAESQQQVSGNYGLLDMIAALQWIRANAAAFGGDPDRVTISGESAGAIAVSMLSASPLAHGLFHGAISQSGGSFGPVGNGAGPGENVQPLAAAEEAGQAFAANLGAQSLAELRQIPAENLLGDMRASRGVAWPIMDGWVIPGDQYTLYQSGRYNNTPVLIGYNSDEGALFGAPRTVEEYHQSVRQRYGPFADQILAAYPSGEATVGKPPRDLIRDTAFGWHSWVWAQLQAQAGGSQAYLYYFDQPTNFPPDSPFAGRDLGAVHGAEIPYIFDKFGESGRAQATADDRALTATMMTYWTNFAKFGDPNGSGLPAWPAYNDAEPQMMHFASGAATVGPLVDSDGLNVLDRYFAWRRNAGASDSGNIEPAEAQRP